MQNTAATVKGVRSHALLVAIKARLRRVVGVSVVAIVASGIVSARLRGLLGGDGLGRQVEVADGALQYRIGALLLTSGTGERRCRLAIG